MLPKFCLQHLRPGRMKTTLTFLSIWVVLILVFFAGRGSRDLKIQSLLPANRFNLFSLLWQQEPATRVRQECIHPTLRVDDPIMMKTVKRYAPQKCTAEDWVYVENGTVKFTVSKLKRNITCDYFPIVREGDYNVTYGDPVLNIPDGFNMTTDFFQISCNETNTNKTYLGLHAGVAYDKAKSERPEAELQDGLDGLSVAIIGYDSMSRMSWLRRLKQTREYILQQGAIELEAHNIVGDGTTAVMFPMLTGKFEWELPESRLNFEGATQLDNFPFIWHDMKKAGYLTSWCNAAPKHAPFNWRMLGFGQKPTDFYTRPFYLTADKLYKPLKYPCIGSRSFGKVWLNYIRDIFVMYREKRKFLFHFLVEMTHDDNNLITKMDLDTMELVKFLQDGGYLNKTLLILMGDHGARYSQIRSTWSGKLEERLPYFSFLFPKWFEQKYPAAIANLRTNTKRLTTPFDLHETFKDFLRFDGTGQGDVSKRGISLFKEVPLERSCEHAGIAPHWCACLAWKNVSLEENGAKLALQYTIDTINNYTSGYRNDCALLAVEKVTDLTKLETRTEVLKFLKADDMGGIYNINFNGTNKNEMTLYQLTFYTTPGHGYFEVTVTHDVPRNKFTVNEKEISRINMYGNDPACILQKNRQIRQYCYCNSNIKS